MFKISLTAFQIVTLAFGCLALTDAWAGYPSTREDFARLPPYCSGRMHNHPALNLPRTEYELWEKRLGPNFLHVHHYCMALNSLNHAATAKNESDRVGLINEAIHGGFEYMESQCKGYFVLMPEIELNKGRALEMLNKKPVAALAYQKAIELNPKYVPAYSSLANLYVRSGQTDVARKILDYGVKANPTSKLLQQKLAELDRKSAASAAGDSGKK